MFSMSHGVTQIPVGDIVSPWLYMHGAFLKISAITMMGHGCFPGV